MFASWLSDLELVVTWLAHAAWQAGLLALGVMVLTVLLGRRLQPRWRFGLWLIVFARLASPALPEASWSLFGFVSPAGTSQATVADAAAASVPQIATELTKSPLGDVRDARVASGMNPAAMGDSARSAAAGRIDGRAPESNTLTLSQIAGLIWIAGVVFLALRLFASRVQLDRRVRQWREIIDPALLSLLRGCGSELRLSRSVSLYATPDTLGPATCGVIRPRIVVPQRLLDRLSSAELRLVLLHELVHVRRHDVLVDQLIGLVTIAHWFHPVAWISRFFLRGERELACDAAVLQRCRSTSATEYGHVILKTIESLAAPLPPCPGLVGMFNRGPSTLLHRRIRLIVGYRRSTWRGPALGVALLLAFALVGLTDAQTKLPPAKPAGESAASSEKQPPVAAAPVYKATPEPEESTTPMPITVWGRAIDADGKPIAGAEIFLASPRTNRQPLATTKTNEEGEYRFEAIPLLIDRGVGSFEVFGHAEGFCFSWRPLKWFHASAAHSGGQEVDDPDLDRPQDFGHEDPIKLDLKFGPPKTVRGRIVNDLGEPLVGARLELRNVQPVDVVAFRQSFESLNETALVPAAVKIRQTDKDGRFEFTDLPGDYKFWIDIRAKGHAPRMIWASAETGIEKDRQGERIYSGDFELVFARPRQVRFHVVYGDTGQPATQVGVGGGSQIVGIWETTNFEGDAEAPLPDGKYQLTLSPRYGTPYLNTTFDVVVSAESVEQPTIVKLRPAAIVDLTVVDGDTGQPLPEVDVWLEEMIAGNERPYRHEQAYRSWEVETRISHYERPQSDKEGKMQVLFEPGRHRIGVGLQKFPYGYQAVEPDGKVIDCQPGKPTAARFAMSKQLAAVPAKPEEDDEPAKADDDEKDEGEAAAKGPDVSEIRHHSLTVTGKALDQSGKPIGGATIFLTATGNSPKKLLGQTVTDGEGRYSFENKELPYYMPTKVDRYEEGMFQVIGKAPGLGFAWGGRRSLFIDRRFIDANGKSTIMTPSYGYFPTEAIQQDLTFLPATPIRGRFIDDQGQPISGVKVQLTNCDYRETTGKEANEYCRELRDDDGRLFAAMPDQVVAVSDADGRFELGSVPEGIVCRLSMHHPEFGLWVVCTATSDSFPAEYAGTAVRGLPIEMTRSKTRSVAVQLRYSDTRQPVIGALVGAHIDLGSSNSWGHSDPQGKVTLNLAPGQYTLWSQPPQDAEYLSAEAKLFVSPKDNNHTAELNFDRACVLVLKAVDATSGAGVENVTFWYERESHPREKRSVQSSDKTNDFPTTGANGELRAIVAAGTRCYGIAFNPLPDDYQADDLDKAAGRVLTLPAGETVTAEFLLKK